jgi:transposase
LHGGVGGSLAFGEAIAIANPMQVKAIAHARVKTDKVDAGTLASLFAAGYLPEIWTSDAATERKRRLTARRYQLARHRTRIKNEVHGFCTPISFRNVLTLTCSIGPAWAWLTR